MKLLLDANLSWRLVQRLKNYFDDCLHVDRTTLSVAAKDPEIWKFAKAHDLILVSCDEDFIDFSAVKGFPPKVILLRTGNQSNESIEALMIKHKTAIKEFISSEDYGLLELY